MSRRRPNEGCRAQLLRLYTAQAGTATDAGSQSAPWQEVVHSSRSPTGTACAKQPSLKTQNQSPRPTNKTWLCADVRCADSQPSQGPLSVCTSPFLEPGSTVS